MTTDEIIQTNYGAAAVILLSFSLFMSVALALLGAY